MPGIRQVGFREDPAQFTVARLLIQAWSVQRSTSECDDPPCGDLTTWAQEISSLTQEERKQLPQNPDTKSFHTPWRDQIYFMWNHVLYDVGNWMSRMYRTGTFVPPNIKVFALEFLTSHETEEDGKVPAVTKVWDSETLLIPAYLAPGATLRVKTLHPGQEDDGAFHPAKFEQEDRYTVWYIKKGSQVQFHVEGDWDQGVDGVAAVMVHGNMSGEPLTAEDFESESDEDEE